MKIYGYDILEGEGKPEGIRYAWKFSNSSFFLESAAFINKTKGTNNGVSGYTTSVSLGCILRHFNMACKFCRTGKIIPFNRLLTAKEIAKQNIFMVLSDIYCSNGHGKNHAREFAYMGQGEPGYSYTQLRLAIKITDYVMMQLHQTVYRHIISTVGILDTIPALTNDLANHFFDSRVTVHFSLHTIDNRDELLPINKIYPYNEVIDRLKKIHSITGEKICVGILLFNEFKPTNASFCHTTTEDGFLTILEKLDSKSFRLSLCEYNSSSELGEGDTMSAEQALKLYSIALDKGYETKLFSSFGKKQNTACGNLGGGMPASLAQEKWRDLEKIADNLIEEAMDKLVL